MMLSLEWRKRSICAEVIIEDVRDFADKPWFKEKKCRAQFNRHGFPCLALRHNYFGTWNGYVAVGEAHPLFGKRGSELPAHGGVGFAGLAGDLLKFSPENPAEKVWLFGFDCGHFRDVIPFFDINFSGLIGQFPGATWKDLRYVMAVCEDMAKALAEFGPSGLPAVAEIEWDVPERAMDRQNKPAEH